MGNDVFLAATMTEPPLDFGTTIQAVLFFSFGLVAHAKNFLKIGTNAPNLPNCAVLH